jgi:hypothetical protein
MKSSVTKGKGSSNLYYLCLKSDIAEGCSKVFSFSDNEDVDLIPMGRESWYTRLQKKLKDISANNPIFHYV